MVPLTPSNGTLQAWATVDCFLTETRATHSRVRGYHAQTSGGCVIDPPSFWAKPLNHREPWKKTAIAKSGDCCKIRRKRLPEVPNLVLRSQTRVARKVCADLRTSTEPSSLLNAALGIFCSTCKCQWRSRSPTEQRSPASARRSAMCRG